ncbi:MAG: acetate kinase [Candidatus Hydrogenedentes bacterium]|nr:acetate kinase [Candidatus Hydrogenedentota bacterium]
MKVLVLNTGSSSVKFRVFDTTNGQATDLAQGLVERIGDADANVVCSESLEPAVADVAPMFSSATGGWDIPNHNGAIRVICQMLMSDRCDVVEDLSEIAGIGHRVVHGGEEFCESTLIDDAVINGIEKCSKLAPLHNPPALEGIRACATAFQGVPQVAVFDTAFHSTIPPKAYRYPLPAELYFEHGVRKYGFHGTSHRYVSGEAIRLLKKPVEETRIITCHLGNGSSIAAVKGGKCVETSMGMTPLGGVMMGTRPGDLDPYLPLFMIKELGMTVDEVDRTLNKGSGLFGVCGDNDMRDIEKRAAEGCETCALALEMFAYKIARFIGSYAMVMGGCDAIVFTAGIGENDPTKRGHILENAGFLGCFVDEARNAANEVVISTDESACKAFVIPTNEELVIACDTATLVGKSPACRQTAVAD